MRSSSRSSLLAMAAMMGMASSATSAVTIHNTYDYYQPKVDFGNNQITYGRRGKRKTAAQQKRAAIEAKNRKRNKAHN